MITVYLFNDIEELNASKFGGKISKKDKSKFCRYIIAEATHKTMKAPRVVPIFVGEERLSRADLGLYVKDVIDELIDDSPASFDAEGYSDFLEEQIGEIESLVAQYRKDGKNDEALKQEKLLKKYKKELEKERKK